MTRREKQIADTKSYQSRHTERNKRLAIMSTIRTVVKARLVLGGVCASCGNSDPMVLQFNHKNNDGKEHRIEIGSDISSLARWINKNPEEANEKIELLCANCHAAFHSKYNQVDGQMDEVMQPHSLILVE